MDAMSSPRLLFSVLSIALVLINTNAADPAEVPFSYTGPTGPAKWGSLGPAYAVCSSGKQQSPIEIINTKAVANQTLTRLTTAYKPATATLFTNGMTLGMNFEGDAGVMTVDGVNYALKKMYWHSPSEHKINGNQYAAELQMIHYAPDGSIAAISAMYKFGHADSLLTKIQQKVGELGKTKRVNNEEATLPIGKYDVAELNRITEARDYYRYVGSLTTPPCNENVIWHVVAHVRKISKDQVELLKGPLDAESKNNARPVQQLSGRVIQYQRITKDKKDKKNKSKN